MGRLTKDPDVRWSSGDNPQSIARYTLAVDRRYKRDDGPTADFIRCVAFGRQGEFADKYLRQGTKIAISGRIETGSYTNRDGQRVYTTEVVVEEHDFCESKKKDEEEDFRKAPPKPDNDGFMDIPDDVADRLPFLT